MSEQRSIVTSILLLGTLLFIGTITASSGQVEDARAPGFHELEGPYLGQEPPGMKREIFAPGIVSDGLFNGLIYFTAGGTEVFFSKGEWSEAKNMGQSVNTASDERRASVSSDGKYLFFESKVPDGISRLPEPPLTLGELRRFLSSAENGDKDVYWVDARVIENLRPSGK